MFVCGIRAQKKAEGEIKYKIQYEGEAIQLNLFFMGNNFRMDKSGKEGESIIMAVNGVTGVLYPAQNVYVEYGDIKDKNFFEKPPVFENMKDELKLIKTEEKMNILGIDCEKWILKNNVTSVEMYVNREIKFNKTALQVFPKYFVDWQDILYQEKACPMLVKIKDDLGNTIYSFEAVDLNLHKLDENTFLIPQGYQKLGIKKEKY